MSEMLILDLGAQISSVATPTPELRWLRHDMRANLAVAHSHTVSVLQQRWQVTDYQGGKPVGMRGEWRDVPTEPAAPPQP